MPVMEKEELVLPPELRDLPEVEYPEEVVERLNKKFEIVEARIAVGELIPKSAAEIAAELGIEIDGE